MCEHADCEHSLGPGSHCDTCDRLERERMHAADYGRSKSNDKRLRALGKPEADPSFNDSLRKSDWKNDERLKDIAHDPSLMPDAVCPTCMGSQVVKVYGQTFASTCPDCHGTGKRAPK